MTVEVENELGEITSVELFFCPSCKRIVRGAMDVEPPAQNADGSLTINGTCQLCGGATRKVEHPKPTPPPSESYHSEWDEKPRAYTIKDTGTIQEPTLLFWHYFVKAVNEAGGDLQIANLLWYTYLTNEEKQEIISRFRETGFIRWHLQPTQSQTGAKENPSGLHLPPYIPTNYPAIEASENKYRKLLDQLKQDDGTVASVIGLLDIAEMLGDEEYHEYLKLLTGTKV